MEMKVEIMNMKTMKLRFIERKNGNETDQGVASLVLASNLEQNVLVRDQT